MRIRAVAVLGVVVSVSACSSKPSTLVNVNVEANGPHCATGGVRVDTGVDKNNDGTLSADEITSTRYVCNGAQGPAGDAGSPGDAGARGHDTLVSVSTEAAGANCQLGGERIDSGFDLNDDGVLSANEITITNYVCTEAPQSNIYFGDVYIYAQADVAALSGIETVVGDMYVDADEAIDLLAIRNISGDLQVSAPGFTAHSLQKLGSLYLYGVDIETLELDALESASSISLSHLPLTTLAFPALTKAALEITNNDELTTLSLPALTDSQGINIGFNESLTSASAPVLNTALDIGIHDNAVLSSISFPELTTTRDLQLQYDPALTTVSFPLLTTTGYFAFNDDAALASLSAPMLTSTGDFGIDNLNALTALSFPALTSTGVVAIRDNATLASMSFPLLSDAQYLVVTNHPQLASVSVPALTGISGYLTIANNPALTSISFTALTTVEFFEVGNNAALTSLSTPAFSTSTGYVKIHDNATLGSVSFPALTTAEELQFTDNASLSSVQLDALSSVSNSLSTSSNNLSSFSAAALVTVEYLSIRSEPSLAQLSLPAARRIGGLELYEVPQINICTLLNTFNTAHVAIPYFHSDANLDVCALTDLCQSFTVTGISAPLHACIGNGWFDDADIACQQFGTGAHLLWFESAAEWTAYSSAVAAGTAPYGFIGYTDSVTEGTFVTVSGFSAYDPTTDTNITFFDDGEPNDNGGEDALEVGGNGLANDVSNSLSRTAICRGP